MLHVVWHTPMPGILRRTNLAIFELVEYDVLVVPDDRRGLAELDTLRQGMALAVCELYVTMHHGYA